MDVFQTIFLALIQGVTEFLPISSSAHLILPAQLLGWQDQGLAFDVAVHFGSLVAVVWYFREDVRKLLIAWIESLAPSSKSAISADARMAWMVLVATLPAVIVGTLTADIIAGELRSIQVIAVTTIGFGLLLGVADFKSRRAKQTIELTWTIAILIGLAQVLALIPGTSRSGVTITAAVLLGMSRTEGARFSFLLSIPIILAGSIYSTMELIAEQTIFSWTELLIALSVSAISAYLCIGIFLRVLEKIGFMPFVWYRLALGGVLFYLVSV